MPTIKQINQKFYVDRKYQRQSTIPKYLVMNGDGYCYVNIGRIRFPREWEGKRVAFLVEELE